MARRTIFSAGTGGGGGSPGTRIQLTPEAFGAKRDGAAVFDVDIASGTASLSASDAEFAAGDVGKTIAVYGAGTSGNGTILVSTIESVESATAVTLADNAIETVNGSRAVYGTDDSAAIEATLDEIVAQGIENGTRYGELWLSPGIYMVCRAAQNGAPYYGSAQIRITPIPEADGKFDLVIKGAGAATFAHWNQTVPQRSGSVLYSTLVGGSNHATWGPPAVLGGPTRVDQGGGFSAGFSNMKLTIDGVTIVGQRNPCVTALHAGRLAQLHVKSLGVLADMTPTQMHDSPPTNDLGMGMRVPQLGNNHYVRVDDFSVEGFYYGLTVADHFTAERVVCVYVNTALYINGGGASEHGMSILNLGVEGSGTILEVSFSEGGRFPIDIAQCNTEIMTSTGFKDNNNALVGYVGFTSNTGSAPTVSGCANLTLIDLNRRPGAISGPDTPAVPTTGTPLTNPFWRNARVLISGGTVTQVAIDGVNTGLTSGWFPLATGKSITVTHSGAPTWKWWAE